MADSKKYDGSQWEHSLRKLTTATEAVENPLYSDGTAITAYTIKGNTVQSGTPTPNNPVEVNGVGVRTDNLFDKFISGIAINTDTGAEVPSSSGFTSDFIPVEDNSIYSYTGGNDTISACLFAYDNAKAYIGRSVNAPVSATSIKTVTTVSGAYTVFASNLTGNANPIAYIRVCHLSGTQAAVESENIMLNTGSTAKPYEPYGYKIPISSAGVTTNIYLGSTQTTRQIKKVVLDGTESNWQEFNNLNLYRLTDTSRNYQSQVDGAICDSLPLVARGDLTTNTFCWSSETIGELIININNYNLADLKTYLNNNPITIWYVLATSETATVNEPLMKIGTYADTLSNAASIPTTEGANSITVDTTVQPSEFTATWTGWHDASVKEKSDNLFDKFISGIAINTDTGAEVPSSSGFTSDFIPVEDNSIYSYTGGNDTISTCLFAYDNAKAYIGRSVNVPVSATSIKTVTTVSGAYTVFASNLTGNANPIAYIRVGHLNGTQEAVDSETIMLNTGSTALPYEPYWK